MFTEKVKVLNSGGQRALGNFFKTRRVQKLISTGLATMSSMAEDLSLLFGSH